MEGKLFRNTLGEIILFGGDFEPAGWKFCDGRDMVVDENRALYSILKTNFGGDGVKTFKLPNLTERVVKGDGPYKNFGNSEVLKEYPLFEKGGSKTIKLSEKNLPCHKHTILASTGDGKSSDPKGKCIGVPKDRFKTPDIYVNELADVSLAKETISFEGKGAEFNSESPYLNLRFLICVDGDYPQRS